MNDLVVIGAGMSGLMAAGAAVNQQKKVLVITKGQGALTLSSGCIDFNLKKLERDSANPLSKVQDVVQESFNFFKSLVKEQDLTYYGTPEATAKVLTALGTVKTTCLVPESMHVEEPEQFERLVAVGFKGYFEFSPELFLHYAQKSGFFPNLKETGEVHFVVEEKNLNPTYLALALGSNPIKDRLITFLKPHVKPKTVFAFPAVLGNLGEKLYLELEKELGAKVVEIPGGLPSIPGQRVYQALVKSLKQKGVQFIHNAEVKGYKEEAGKVISVLVEEAGGRVKEVYAKSFVLATGSFWGKGIIANGKNVVEPIFGAKVFTPEDFAENYNFLGSGIITDNFLRPRQDLTNLFAAGDILAHTNYLKNNSGLGLALATGYKAGILAVRESGVKESA
ncbi:anaerobic glycerol-3-phosphate dehydrogenase subunit B [Carboxydothermus pertinax]|uniref:Anaerobic glycerol-3-phosphate dehydrogenase subunit B n=1 Tax=Carboxydothermus pertinax TaxID=870242 RepID=A0A1L8CSQ9_9THEO|nr:anaerobic glycerol-3-phosphate dehydrogenase subunit B [Carboxydothermus pertinax]GAV21894.1 anaerobic glycerol-3-phosphate dehydrogenase subunit B [Carboxydothermus pertinax]